MAGRLVGYAERQARAAAKIGATAEAPLPQRMAQTARAVGDIARVCHEVNRAYCASIGDDTQLPWDEAADWQRESAVKGVTFAIENPDAAPSAQHDAWLSDKLDDGWKYGPVKNPETKEHPCIVPYEELPPEQRAKDYLFLAVVRAMAPQKAS